MSEPRSPSSSSSSGSRPSGGWQPPSLEAMRAMLPQYQFECLLGRGGMGAVYKAVQVSLDRPVAIKVLPSDLIDDTDSNFLERFKNEARTMARMNHPAIVNVYDFGETNTGLLYFVMEFINGTDVAQMIASQKQLPEDYALSITAHVCDALQYAHTHGVIHRDIKPANILINMDGAVKVADFGLAKQNDASQSGLTKTNMAMGTPDFVAPEALIPGVPLDGRADLYAIGVMLYQMLTGEIPRGMWTMPGLKRGTDPRFDAIIARAMQTDREERYQSAAELRKDLDSILTVPRVRTQPPQQAAAPPAQTTAKPMAHGPRAPQQKPAAAVPDTHAKPAAPGPKKSALGLWIGLAAAFVAIGAGLFFMSGSKQSKKDSAAAASTAVTDDFMEAVAAAKPEEQVRLVKEKIEAINGNSVKVTPTITKGVVTSINISNGGTAVSDFSPVAALTGLKQFRLYYQTPTDISFLRGMALDAITIHGGTFTDVSVLRDMPLTSVEVRNGPARDWSVLAGKPLKTLDLMLTGTSDISFVKGMPLNRLLLARSKVTDLSPIRGLPLTELTAEIVPARDLELLRSIKTLKRINEKPADEFYASIESAKPSKAAPPPPPDSPARPKPPEPRLATSAPAPEPAPVPRPMPAPAPTAAPSPPSDPVSAKLADLESKFQAALERDAGAAYKAQVATLNTSYTAALDRALAAASKAGQLEEVVALREEKERMGSGRGLPPEDLDTLPPSLKKLRGTWRGTESGYASQRDAKATPLYGAYDKTLDAFQTELTKQNKIDDALRVKTAREELSRRRPASTSAVVDAPASKKAKPAAAAAPVKEEGEGGSSWRKAAEWVLSIGGNMRVRRVGGQELDVREANELPSGRFDIVRISLDMSPEAGAEVTDDDLTRLNGLRGLEIANFSHLRGITGGGLAALLSCADSLKELRLYDMPVEPQHMGMLSQLKKLRNLNLDNLPKLTADSLAFLGSLKDLRILTVRQSPLDDRVLLSLSGLTELTTLDVSNTAVTDEGLAVLRGMKNLGTLALENCKGVRGSGLAHLKGLSSLTHLHLTLTSVTDDSLAAIAGCSGLTQLELRETPVTSACLRHLAQLKKLEMLNLSAPQFNGVGLDALAGCASLRRLYLGGGPASSPCGMTDEGLRDLAAAKLLGLQDLTINGEAVTTAGIAYLAPLKLKWLALHHHPGAEGLQAVLNMQSLEALDLGHGPLSDADLPVFKGLKSLKTLAIYDSEITDAGLKVFEGMPALNRVTLRKSKTTQTGREAVNKARPDLTVGL